MKDKPLLSNSEIRELIQEYRFVSDFCTKQRKENDKLQEEYFIYRQQFFRFFLDERIKILSTRERRIIKMRFGFYSDTPTWSYIEDWFVVRKKIAKKLNLTEERIRQIEAKALEKLNSTYAIE